MRDGTSVIEAKQDMTDRPAIIGVGNVLMGDDGVGPAAVEALRRAAAAENAELVEAGLAFSEVLCDIDPARPVVIIDAVRGGGPPGSIYRLTVDDLAGDSGSMPSAVSLHEVNVLPALRMEALAGRDFTDVTIFGVEPDTVAWGQGLSAPVAEAVKKLTGLVSQYLQEKARGHATCAECARE